MADQTGTLGENDGAYGSCHHGFASPGGVHVLYRDVLGLYRVDSVNQAVQRRFIGEQEAEIKRVNARFDDELVRLRQLWTTIAPAASK